MQSEVFKRTDTVSLKNYMLAISQQSGFKIVTEDLLENEGEGRPHVEMARTGRDSLAHDPNFYPLLWAKIACTRAGFTPPEKQRSWDELIAKALEKRKD